MNPYDADRLNELEVQVLTLEEERDCEREARQEAVKLLAAANVKIAAYDRMVVTLKSHLAQAKTMLDEITKTL